jgi:hypothetical protein
VKGSVTLALAAAALAISIWSATTRRPAKPPLEPAHLPPPPRSGAVDCDAPDVTTIDALMRKPINSTMSQLAYALYHDPGDPARRFELVADHAARLLGCIHLMPNLPPEDVAIDGLPDYFRFLASMQENALGLRTAALEGDAGGARHWFAHLKQDCAACHSRFRVEVPRAEALPR